ncbi:MAG: NAD(P)H-dependent oxidoreductase subunit E [Deltaproteobacteria bacterium]|jgi:NADH-quinone oxidoreductase subunit E|nr:NAD(P)H-dependent oxidoreductase subunit E [Deltaproteobacteria bacterium]
MQELTESRVKAILEGYGNDAQQLIAVLLDVQEASGKNFVERRWAELTAKTLGLPISTVYEIITFYSMFATAPRGCYVIELCKSAPCHFQEAERILTWFEDELGIKVGETTLDGLFTLTRCSCLGACDVGPAVRVGDSVYGTLTKEKVSALLRGLREEGARLGEEL